MVLTTQLQQLNINKVEIKAWNTLSKMSLESMLHNMTFNESEVDPFEIQVFDKRSADLKTKCMITFLMADLNLKSKDPRAVQEALKTVTHLAEDGFASNSVFF